MLEIDKLVIAYGGISAVRGVSASVRTGQLVAIVGSNGAGKSSLLQSVAGLVRQSAGSISLNGEEIGALAPHRIARRGVLLVPEGRWILPGLSVKENLTLGSEAARRRHRAGNWGLSDVFDLFPVLADRRAQEAGSLSGGQQQMLAIGRGLMGQPEVLMLDEPSLGLAPIIVDRVFDTLADLKSRGLTMLVVEQNAMRALSVADYAYVIERGTVVKSGHGSDLMNDPDVVASYLGG